MNKKNDLEIIKDASSSVDAKRLTGGLDSSEYLKIANESVLSPDQICNEVSPSFTHIATGDLMTTQAGVISSPLTTPDNLTLDTASLTAPWMSSDVFLSSENNMNKALGLFNGVGKSNVFLYETGQNNNALALSSDANSLGVFPTYADSVLTHPAIISQPIEDDSSYISNRERSQEELKNALMSKTFLEVLEKAVEKAMIKFFSETATGVANKLVQSAKNTVAKLSGKSESQKYVFKQVGEFWEIIFDGKKAILKNTKGLAYICYLLKNPHKEIHVCELEKVVKDRKSIDYITDVSETPKIEDYSILGENLGKVTSQKALNDYWGKIKEIDAKIKEAVILEDEEKIAILERDREFILKEIKNSTDKQGNIRNVSNPDINKIRKRVLECIIRSQNKIINSFPAKDFPDFSQAISAIVTGEYCQYRPKTNIVWEFS